MKTRNSIAYKKLIFEFISISFAVFLGLMLNQWKENHNNKILVRQSLENISIEIEKNSSRVQEMLDSHKLLLSKVDNLLANIDKGTIPSDNLGELSFQLISSTAWETAKLTQSIAHMDIGIVSEIAGIYEYQHYYSSVVKQQVMSDKFQKSFSSLKDIKDNKGYFIELRDFLQKKIIASESDLLEYYKKLQEDISVYTKG